ncbi:MAG TPA: carboxypeptidase regulatory-like domain-containing protein [Terriglobia bacterium]|nr:carboxypeptidase regulatory-like domain-containing protein [Terriglobia bacterium]
MRRLISELLLVLLAASAAFASVTGSISGTVKDSSGAVIPGVAVKALNTQTGVSQTLTTDAEGFYAFPSLSVGRYQIEVRRTGFKDYRQMGLAVDVNTALRVDVTLQVGSATQEVTVSSATVHVETQNTQMGEVIGGASITAMPLNGRSYTDLLALQPGVAPQSTGEYGAGFSPSGDLNPGNLSVSGQRESANGFMVNGGDVEEGGNMGAAVIPNLDSIAEFRILTNNFDAEYGNYSGGLVNVVTKSGTNQFHGDAFEFLRFPNLDSRNFYSASRATLHRNQFGGTFGGPIVHDRVFFFADYQGTRQVAGQDTGNIPVLSPAERNGDFSDMAGQLSGTVSGPGWANTLAQELGYPVATGEAYYAPGCTSSSQCVFPNAVIPHSALSTPTKALLQYIPPPNVPGGFFSTSAFDETLRDDKFSYRVDSNTRWGLLSGYYFFDDFNLVNPYQSSNLPGFATSTLGRSQQANFGDTKSFGSAAVNELRLNYTREATDPRPTGGIGPSLASQGLTGIVPLNPQLQGVENVGTNEFSIGVNPFTESQINNTAQVLDNFSIVRGTHTLKFGGSFHLSQIDIFDRGANNGTFSFDGSETGSDFADFLIGAPASYQQGSQVPMYTTTRYYALYAQDSWRARENLTLNYGLRWEVSTPWYEKHNQIETIVPGVQSVVFPGAPEGWVFPGDPGIPRTLAPTRYHNFGPRIGLAYSPSASEGLGRRLWGEAGKTSIRMSYGVFYTAFEDATSFNEVGDAPFGYYWSSPAPPLFATPFVDRATGNNEGQRFPVPFPPLNAGPSNPDKSINWAQFIPISSSPGFFYKNGVPYSEDYMVSFQRQLDPNTVLTLSYVGTQGHRLLADLESNPADPALCLSLSQQSEVVPGTGTCGPFAEDGPFYPASGGVIPTTRTRFKNGLGSNGWFATMANSNYNAFEASLRHTGRHSSVLASYTYSKAMDNASSWGPGVSDAGEEINPVNPKISKALSAFDLTHNFVVSYSYELPFERLLRANKLSQGWIVTGITHYTTGLPVTITEQDDNSLLGTWCTGPTCSVVDTPNFTPGPLQFTNPRSGNVYFNTSLFSPEALGQLGNSNRRFFHGPGIANWDFGLMKDLNLTESKKLEFRAEFFNIFNHAQFGPPQGDIINSAFGLVTSASDPRIGQLAIKLLF